MADDKGIARSYCEVLKRGRFLVFGCWLAIVLLGLKWGSKFTSATTAEYSSAYDSPSSVAQREIGAHFPSTLQSQSVCMLLALTPAGLTHGYTPASFLAAVKPVEMGLYAAMASEYNLAYPYNATNATTASTAFIRSVEAYWLIEAGYDAIDLAKTLVASDGHSTIISVVFDSTNADDVQQMVDFLTSQTQSLLSQHGLQDAVSAGVTGLQPFATAILAGVKDDLEFMDTAVLPLALVILSLVIRSATLMIIPILNIIITILAEFLVMYPVALSMDVVSFTPSLMMSITIAMSIDYSLFLLSRFMEELSNGQPVDEAIVSMVHGAGHTILVSGGTLVCCFLGMLIFPMAMLQSVGIGASVTLFFAISVNLTLTPALLYSIGKELVFYQASLEHCFCRPRNSSLRSSMAFASLPHDKKSSSISSNQLAENLLGETSYEPSGFTSGDATEKFEVGSYAGSARSSYLEGEVGASSGRDSDEALESSLWFKLASELLNPKKGAAVLVVVCALAAPICTYCLQVDTSISFDMSVPSDSDAYTTFSAVEGGFGAGAVFPYKLLFVPKNATAFAAVCGNTQTFSTECTDEQPCSLGFMCQDAFDQVNEVLSSIEIVGAPHSTVSAYLGISQLNGTIPMSDYTAAFYAKRFGQPLTPYQSSIMLLYGSSCESNLPSLTGGSGGGNMCTSTVVSVLLEEDPYSIEGVDWLKAVRSEMDTLSAADDFLFDLFLGNGAGTTYDVTTAVYDSFPLIVVVTLGTVFALMALAFQSLVAPLRSVATLALTLAFVFGLAVLVYQHGAFEFLSVRCLGKSDAISWLPPVMCFSIIVGLGLDYDVFLVSRVFEYRLEGFSDHDAAVKGVCSTGYIITAAGLIMAVAFGGLFSSSELILNQSAFLLVFAVLLDTFVVRTLAVPALLGLTDTKSWWPKTMPPVTRALTNHDSGGDGGY